MKHARSNVIFCSNFPTFMFFQWSWVEIRYHCPFSCNNTSKVGSDPNLGHYKVGYRENLPFHCSSPILPILHIWTNVACSHMTQTRTSGVLASVMWNLLKHVEMQTLGSFFFFFLSERMISQTYFLFLSCLISYQFNAWATFIGLLVVLSIPKLNGCGTITVWKHTLWRFFRNYCFGLHG